MLQVWRTSGRARCSPETPPDSHPKHLHYLEDLCSVSQSVTLPSILACLLAYTVDQSYYQQHKYVTSYCAVQRWIIPLHAMPCHAMLCGASGYHEAWSMHWRAALECRMNRKGEGKRQAPKLKTKEEGECKVDTQSRITCAISTSKERKGKKKRKGKKGRRERKEGHQHW